MTGQIKVWSGHRFAISLLPCAIIGLVWLWSGWYEIGIGPRMVRSWLCTLRNGTLVVQVSDLVNDDDRPIEPPPGFWEAVWRPDPAPALGVVKRPAFDIGWTWPDIKNAVCWPACWWTIQLPLWLVFVGGASWPACKLRRALRHTHQASRGTDPVRALVTSGVARYRIAALLRWSGIVACGLLLAAWAASAWYGIWLNSGDRWMLKLTNGEITLEVDRSLHGGWFPSAAYVFIGRNPDGGWSWSFFPHTWDFQMPMGCTQRRGVMLPLWYALAPIAVLTARSFRRHARRPLPGHCEQCRYDLTGNVSGVCPECGTPCGPPPPTRA